MNVFFINYQVGNSHQPTNYLTSAQNTDVTAKYIWIHRHIDFTLFYNFYVVVVSTNWIVLSPISLLKIIRYKSSAVLDSWISFNFIKIMFPLCRKQLFLFSCNNKQFSAVSPFQKISDHTSGLILYRFVSVVNERF